MKFSLLINLKMPTIDGFFIFISKEILSKKFSLIINLKMPTIDAQLCLSKKNLALLVI